MNNKLFIPDSYSYFFSKDKKRCTIIAVGEVDYEQTIQMMDEVIGHVEFSPDTLILVDLTDIDYHPNYQEFENISSHLKSRSKDLSNRVALVCSLKMQILTQLICIFMEKEKLQIKAFTLRENAEDWLEIKKEVKNFSH